MDKNIKKVQKQLNDLSILIDETRNRLPAHSTKPPIMMELLDLEDQYDALTAELKKLKDDA